MRDSDEVTGSGGHAESRTPTVRSDFTTFASGYVSVSATGLAKVVADHTGYECVGIRLLNRDDYPYLSHAGFPADFVHQENSIRQAGCGFQGRAECLCGLVIEGRGMDGCPYLSPEGIFRCDDLMNIDAGAMPGLSAYRGECPRQGLRSVVLIPLRRGGLTIGLLQLADRRPGLANRYGSDFYRSLGDSLGDTLHRLTAGEIAVTRVMSDLAAELIRTATFREAAESTLKAALRLCPASLGFVARAERRTGRLVVCASLPGAGPERAMLTPEGLAGMVNWAMSNRRSFYTNAPARDALQAGLTVSGGPVDRLLATPVLDGDISMGVIVLANAERDYNLQDVSALERLALVFALGLRRRQAEDESSGALQAVDSGSLARSELLAALSHDIKTPVNAIRGLVGLLQRTDLSDIQSDYLRILRKTAESLGGILEDLLDLSRIESGRIALCIQDYDPAELAVSVCEMFQPEAADKGLTLNWWIAPETPVTAVGDPLRLRQILVNLVGNALKFTSLGGVSVSAGIDRDRPGRIVYEVADSGVGIAPDRLRGIFGQFRQVGSAAGGRYGGSGLGLTICRRLLAMMSGEISARSKVGQGSVFTISVPARLPVADGHESSAPETQGRRTILVVDDDTIGRIYLTSALKRLGHRAEAAENAARAKAWLAGESFDLVFMNLSLPDQDGIALTLAIRQGDVPSVNPGVRIVGVSTVPPLNTDSRCREIRMDAFLVKPLGETDILKALAVLDQPAMIAMSGSGGSGAASAPDAGGGVPVLDDAVLRVRYGGRPDVLRDRLLAMRDDLPRLVGLIREALDSRDPGRAQPYIHRLGGAAGALGATSLRDILARIDELARLGNLAEAGRLVVSLPEVAGRLEAAIVSRLKDLT